MTASRREIGSGGLRVFRIRNSGDDHVRLGSVVRLQQRDSVGAETANVRDVVPGDCHHGPSQEFIGPIWIGEAGRRLASAQVRGVDPQVACGTTRRGFGATRAILVWLAPRPATFAAFRTSSDTTGSVLVLGARPSAPSSEVLARGAPASP